MEGPEQSYASHRMYLLRKGTKKKDKNKCQKRNNSRSIVMKGIRYIELSCVHQKFIYRTKETHHFLPLSLLFLFLFLNPTSPFPLSCLSSFSTMLPYPALLLALQVSGSLKSCAYAYPPTTIGECRGWVSDSGQSSGRGIIWRKARMK